MEEPIVIYIRPGRCNTCRHHTMGEYFVDDDYQEHWCDLEENERGGWFPGMHLDNCLFPARTADEVCPAWELMDLPAGQDWQY